MWATETTELYHKAESLCMTSLQLGTCMWLACLHSNLKLVPCLQTLVFPSVQRLQYLDSFIQQTDVTVFYSINLIPVSGRASKLCEWFHPPACSAAISVLSCAALGHLQFLPVYQGGKNKVANSSPQEQKTIIRGRDIQP